MPIANFSNINYWNGPEAQWVSVPNNIFVYEQRNAKTVFKLFYSLNLLKENKVIISFLYNKYKNSSRWKEFWFLSTYFSVYFHFSRLFLVGDKETY